MCFEHDRWRHPTGSAGYGSTCSPPRSAASKPADARRRGWKWRRPGRAAAKGAANARAATACGSCPNTGLPRLPAGNCLTASSGAARPRFGALDQTLGGRPPGEGAFLFAGPPTPGELGAAFVAATIEHVAVAGQQRSRGDELLAVMWAGKPQPHGAAVGGVPKPDKDRLPPAVGRPLRSPKHHPAAPGSHHIKRATTTPPPRSSTCAPRGARQHDATAPRRQLGRLERVPQSGASGWGPRGRPRHRMSDRRLTAAGLTCIVELDRRTPTRPRRIIA